MFKIIDFSLLTETKTKDATGQTSSVDVPVSRIGKQKSIYQNEFYKADQAGIRPQGVIEMSAFDSVNSAVPQVSATPKRNLPFFVKGAKPICFLVMSKVKPLYMGRRENDAIERA